MSLLLSALQCAILNEKLDSLLQTLNTECQALTTLPLSTPPIVEEEHEEEEEEEEEASEESLTELKEKLEEEETEKGIGGSSPHQLFKSREQLMLRANSLKKAVRQVIEQAERGTHTELQYEISVFVHTEDILTHDATLKYPKEIKPQKEKE